MGDPQKYPIFGSSCCKTQITPTQKYHLFEDLPVERWIPHTTMNKNDTKKAKQLLSEALDPNETDPWLKVDQAYDLLDNQSYD